MNAITKKFDDGISSVHKQLRGLTRGFADINGALQVAQQAFGLAVRAAESFSNEIDRLDELVDASNRLGITADSLQKFHRAAEIASGDVESMNRALAVFQRTLGDAALGQSGAVKAFERIGMNAQALSEAGLERAFTAVLAKLGQIPNAAERASIGADLFGKSAMNLTDLLANGSTAIQQATNDINQFGVSLNKSAQDIDRAKRSIEQLKMATSSLGTEATLMFAPLGATMAGGAATAIGGLRRTDWGELIRSLAISEAAGQRGMSLDLIRREFAKGVGRSMLASPSPLASPDAFSSRLSMESELLDAYMSRNLFRPRGAIGAAGGRRGTNPFQQVADLRDLVGGSFGREARSFAPAGGSAALEFGTAAAFSAIQQSRREDESARLQKQELEETKKTNKLLERAFENAIVLSALDLQG